MSISEARRQIDKAIEEASVPGWNSADTLDQRILGQLSLTIAHVGSALVEAIAENKPYDGTLNEIRVPLTTLRGIALDAQKAELEDIGLEDLITSIRARLRSAALDD